MVETADLGKLNDLAELRRLHLSGLRCILAESKVRPGSVVVAEIASEGSSQMTFVENNHMVEAFTPDGTDDALDIRIGLGRRMHPMQIVSNDIFG